MNEVGGALASGDEGEFKGTFSFQREKVSDEIIDSEISMGSTVYPSEILWALYEAGYEEVEIGIMIHYKDASGVRDPIRLATSTARLDGYTTISEAWEQGEPVTVEKEPKFNHQVTSYTESTPEK